MITPLGQRQMFQTINAEAVKAALEVSGQFQRELAQRQDALDRFAEDRASVPGVPTAEGLRTEERQGGRREPQPEGHGEAQDREGLDDLEGVEAKTAEGHLDLLA
jgi:hypothetical protein